MNISGANVGDEVFYTVLERAELMAVGENKTHAMIKVLTGPQKGQVFEVPWDKLQILEK
jgi:hypothetical protein